MARAAVVALVAVAPETPKPPKDLRPSLTGVALRLNGGQSRSLVNKLNLVPAMLNDGKKEETFTWLSFWGLPPSASTGPSTGPIRGVLYLPRDLSGFRRERLQDVLVAPEPCYSDCSSSSVPEALRKNLARSHKNKRGLVFGKWAWVDSNHRPHAYQAAA